MTVLIPLLVVVILFCEPRLRELLASEENEYFTEMQLKEETIEEKKDRGLNCSSSEDVRFFNQLNKIVILLLRRNNYLSIIILNLE